jgi:methylenetetrahydrofolate--tRNA-(uracil-5-)-methyltransferase
MRVRVIGGGLAGPEAALVAARMGVDVDLYEMRPVQMTPAHETANFGELVCSNSLKSESENTAPWLLKQEMRRAGSPLLACADASAVPAGHALAVDRVEFSRLIEEKVAAEARITVHRVEVQRLDADDGITIVASGPLTSSALSQEIARLTGSEHLAFYDSISPIVEADSIDREKVYLAARYDKGTADYINCPMTQPEYQTFHDALMTAESAESKEWEKLEYFEGCLPIEELARRGLDTLRFGPMKPVGLRDPRTGRQPWAVVQLRVENLRANSYNLVGFQNHMKYGEQARIFRIDSGAGECEVFALRADSPEHIHQRSEGADADAEYAAASRNFFCRADFRRGRVHRIDCDGDAGGNVRSGASPGQRTGAGSAGDSAGVAGAVHHGGRCKAIPAGEYYV